MRFLLLLPLFGCVVDAPKDAAAPTDAADDTAGGDTDVGDTDDTDETDDTDDTDSGGLSDGPCAPLEVRAEATDIATVMRVRWRTEEPSQGHVAFGRDASYGHVTPLTELATEHEMLLLGMTADTDVAYKVVTENSTCNAESAQQAARTGSLPSGLFPTRATGTASWSGYSVLPLQGTGYAVVIIDNEGRYVWYHQVENMGNLMRAFLSADGKHVVICHAGPQDALENGKIIKVSLDGSEVTEIPFPGLDHDITELPDGTIASIVVEEREGGISADRIVELAPDGTLTTIFNAWDIWDPAEIGVPSFERNWVHGNGLDYYADEDAYYLSMKAMRTLAKIDRATGDVVWTMNGLLNEFDHSGGEPIQMHHQFEVLDGSILFFENGEPSRAYSRAVEVLVDEEAMTTEEIWSYIADPPLYVFAKGDVHRLPGDITQVVWSSAGQIQDVSASGEVLWQLDLDLGQAMTFTQNVPSMYASLW